jgi:hypothetical protein
MSKRLLACVLGVLTLLVASATATAAPGPPGVQTADQSAGSQQGAVAASGATQVQPSNTNIGIRVFSPGNDGSVSQSNDVSSEAEAENENKTKQDADQSQGGAGGIQTAAQAAANGQLAGAVSAATQYGASNKNVPIRVGSEGDNGSVEQSNDASSKAEAENENKTKQDADQSQAGSSCCTPAPAAADAKAADPKAADTKVAEPKADACCASAPSVQTADQSADSKQAAAAHSAAVQKKPSNTNVSIRVGSEGDNGSVEQSNEVSSKAEAENENKTKQDADQSQGGAKGKDSKDGCCPSQGGIQVSDQDASNHQAAAASSTAVQEKPKNTNISIRVFSPGDDGDVTQSNTVSSKAEAENENKTKQDADQSQGGGHDSKSKDGKDCGCASGTAIQTADQSAKSGQLAVAKSDAIQIGAKNVNMPIRVGSPGDNGSVEQSNEVSSKAEAENENKTKQDVDQTVGSGGRKAKEVATIDEHGADGCCPSGTAVQTATQSSFNGQLAGAASAAAQFGASNHNAPIRVKSEGDNGSVEQENEVSSKAEAENENKTKQDVDQTVGSAGKGKDMAKGAELENGLAPANAVDGHDGKDACCHGGTAIQTADQSNASLQGAGAFSAAVQKGASNDNAPVRVKSDGDDGDVEQSNEVSSKAEAENENRTKQDADQSIGSGGSGTGIQTGYQTSFNGQLAGAVSAAAQFGASNHNAPVRVKSEGGGGSVEQENDVSSKAEAENENKTKQDVDQTQKAGRDCKCADGTGIQVAGQKAVNLQGAKAASFALQDFGKSECGCPSGGNSNSPTRVYSPGDDGSVEQENEVSSKAEAENENRTKQDADQKQFGGSGIGIQVAGQQAFNGQLAGALSAAAQFGASNRNSPTRVYSLGSGGSVEQSNEADSEAEAENENKTKQDVDQWQIGHDRCGCADGLGIQVAGQSAKSLQGASALSAALQVKPSNSNKPASVWSPGDGGSVDQSNETDSEGEAENGNRLKQLAHQLEL